MSIAERAIPGPWVPEPDSFAKRLVWVRLELDMTQAEAAAACGIKQPTWASWEANPQTAPRNQAEVAMKIEQALGVNRDWLMWGNPIIRWSSDPRHLTCENYASENADQLPLDFDAMDRRAGLELVTT